MPRQHALGGFFHRPVMPHQLATGRRQLGAAARSPARRRYHDTTLKGAVQLLDQQPGAPIRHCHRSPGGGNRSGALDQFEQPDLARADGVGGREVDADGELRHAPIIWRSERHAATESALINGRLVVS